MFEEIMQSIELLITSKIAVAAISLFWVTIEIKNQREERKLHFEERQAWAERIERLTESLNRTLSILEAPRAHVHENENEHRH